MIDKAKLVRKLIFYLLLIIAIYALLFFPTAGTLNYWQAWMYIILLIMMMTAMTIFLIRTDPELLIRRLQFRERRKAQKQLITWSYPVFIIIYILPGFDQRFGWSNMAPAISIAAEVLVAAGYFIVALVFRENSYTSRIIEVKEGQKVIDTGPYAIVRHPMYVGALMLYIMSPLALGSWVAGLVSLIMIPIIVIRIHDEEATLVEELEGYREYREKVRYRLIPGIW
jgi:protein-S-isoprenylcysteine O-methyltransferase Ste14